MSQPTTLVLNHPKPFDALGENSQIVLGVLREDGWTIDRVEGGQHLLLCAVPYMSRNEEEVHAVRLRAMTEAYEARMRSADDARRALYRDVYRQLCRTSIALSLLPLLYGGYSLLFELPHAFLTFFGGVVLLNSALGFLFEEKRYV